MSGDLTGLCLYIQPLGNRGNPIYKAPQNTSGHTF